MDFSKYSPEVQAMMEKVMATLTDEIGDNLPSAYELDLSLLADSLELYTQARNEITTHGILVDSGKAKVKNPAVAVLNSTQLFISKLINQFGLTRMAKSKLKENTDGLSAQDLLATLTA